MQHVCRRTVVKFCLSGTAGGVSKSFVVDEGRTQGRIETEPAAHLLERWREVTPREALALQRTYFDYLNGARAEDVAFLPTAVERAKEVLALIEAVVAEENDYHRTLYKD
jgi:hypothetical protein